MSTDNPFAPGAGDFRNEEGSREPVPMEPMAILERSWEILIANPGTVIGAMVIPAIPSFAFSFANQMMQVGMEGAGEENPELAMGLGLAVLCLTLVSFLLNLYFQLGTIRIYTRLSRGLPAEISMLFGEVGFLLPAAVAVLFVAVAVVTGFLLLIVPGIILSLGLQFALYAMVDQDLGPIEAIQESWRLTDGHKITVFLVNLVLVIGVLAVGCMTCGLGFVFAAPLLALTQAVMYHSLTHLQGPRPQFV